MARTVAVTRNVLNAELLNRSAILKMISDRKLNLENDDDEELDLSITSKYLGLGYPGHSFLKL